MSADPLKVAVVGSGIAGLAAVHTLQRECAASGHDALRLSLFEAGPYFGGHTNTVDVTLPGKQGPVTHGVDTGFLVLNERTYPELIALFKTLDVPLAKSDMSFSVQARRAAGHPALEWSGSSLNSVFAQRSNLLSPRFMGMLADLLRFNRLATRLAKSLETPQHEDTRADAQMRQPLGDFLRECRFGKGFCEDYFLPMMACIWSCPAEQMLEFPVATMLRFCHNHGLLQVSQRPQWWTVAGGARRYVDKITASIGDKRLNTPVRQIRRGVVAGAPLRATGVHIATDSGVEYFDKVIVATHCDQALAMLQAPSLAEQRTLGAIRYQPNIAVLHTDTTVLPTREVAWAAWNYERVVAQKGSQVCLHYLINRLQPLPWTQPVVVSLNPLRPIDERQMLAEFDYAHPVFDLAAIKAQRQMPWLQGQQDTYFCGAWMGYGFHEDGLKAGAGAARQLLADLAKRECLPAERKAA